MSILRQWTVIAVLAALALIGCGGSDEVTSIRDALDAGDGTPAELAGFFVRTGDDARLCTALLESFPPQCGGESISVTGIDESSLDTQSEGNVTWTNDSVTLNGTIENGILEVEG